MPPAKGLLGNTIGNTVQSSLLELQRLPHKPPYGL
jgi:hypothetical protein